MSPRLQRDHPFALRLFAVAVLFAVTAVVAPRCASHGAADGTPCTSPFDCSSGFCVFRSGTVQTCGHVCTTDSDCTGTDVCGSFDFAGINDAGMPDPSSADTVQVCRPTLAVPCTACATANCLTVGTPSDGLCTVPCMYSTDCANGLCILASGQCNGLCAPPCDTLRECPRYFVCDRVHTDSQGHGRCIPIDPDAGLLPAGGPDASCGIDP